jgi:parvulin-like peptidyl-prolyl isomerase
VPVPTLITVNGRACDLGAALRADVLQGDAFLPRVIDSLLILDYAEKHGIRNTDQELQLAFDELRYAHGLESVEATNRWIHENRQTLDSIQDVVNVQLLKNKMRNSFSESQILARYAERQLELETVELYSLRVETEDRARELLAQVREEEANFHVLAMRHSTDDKSRPLGGFVGKLTRSQVTPDVEASVFKAKPGTVIGPVKTDRGWNLFMVTAVHKPTVQEAKDEIRSDLMEETMSRLRSAAAISLPLFEGPGGVSSA